MTCHIIRFKLGYFLITVEMIFLCLFIRFANYGEDLVGGRTNIENSKFKFIEQRFQNNIFIIFIGLGFILTFLKRYGYSSISFIFLISALSLQWALLCQGFFLMRDGKFQVNISSLLTATLACAAVFISFSPVLGVTTPLQLSVMALMEIAIYACNDHISLNIFQLSDVGASITVHVFGAYFGLAASFVLRRNVRKESFSLNSNSFSMIGTILLWLFFPSFNAGLRVGDAQHRAIINTYFSMASCCVTGYAISSFVRKQKFDMVYVQNYALAGGVAIGTSADMLVRPHGALIVGAIAGTLTVLGNQFLTPVLNKRLGFHDTCGVHDLHGIPGIFGAIVGAITASMATETNYKLSLYSQFPARGPMRRNSTEFWNIRMQTPDDIELGLGRSAMHQAGYQMAGLGVSIAMAIAGGLVTGLFLRDRMFGEAETNNLVFDDPDPRSLNRQKNQGKSRIEILRLKTRNIFPEKKLNHSIGERMTLI